MISVCPLAIRNAAWTLNIIRESLTRIFKALPSIKDNAGSMYAHIDWASRKSLRAPRDEEKILVINAGKFQPEGEDCDARLIVAAYQSGLETFYCIRL